MAEKGALKTIANILVVIGALNWGLAIFGADVANWAAASWWQTLVTVIYALVGLSGIWALIDLFK